MANRQVPLPPKVNEHPGFFLPSGMTTQNALGVLLPAGADHTPNRETCQA